MIRLRIIGLPLLAAFLFSACATAPTIKDAEKISAETSVVFGSVEVWVGDEQEKWGMGWLGENHFYLMILPEGTNQAITYRVGKDGRFYWALQPGDYVLLGYRWHKNQEQRWNDLGATFEVRDGAANQYIGALVLRGNEFLMQSMLVDNFDEASRLFDTKYPARAGTAVKSLAKWLPPDGTFSSVFGQCHESWQIECTKKFSGVIPVSPKVTDSGFPTAASLTPEFRWTGSSRDDVTYDLILHEAAEYHIGGGALIPQYMKGRQVAYVQDIEGTSWAPQEPLQPGHKYYWSVRLRDGDTVSRWSTHSHFTFMLVAMSSGFGQWFQFETP